MEKDQEMEMETEDEVIEDEEDEIDEDEVIEDEEEEDESSEQEESDEEEDEVSKEEISKQEQEKARKEQNRINAQRRIEEKQRREKELREEGYNKALKESVGGVNPYTNKPIKDDADMQVYLKMRKLDNEGKDPINDFFDEIAQEQRDVIQKQKDQEQLKSKVTEDLNELTKKYPNLDTKKLFDDPKWNKFAKGKMGNLPLTEVYEDFIEFINEYEDAAENNAKIKAEKKYQRVQSSMGSMKSDSGTPKKNYKTMSDAEFDEELRKKKESF